MRIRLSQRRNKIIAAKQKAQRQIVAAILPVMQARFKELKRELREGGSLRKQLKHFYKGGDGSGNFGHAGRPGEVGGSGEGGGEKTKQDVRSWSTDNPADASRGADTLSNEQSGWENNLTPGQREAISNFTDTNYGDEINRYMRTGDTVEIPPEEVSIQAQRLQDALSKASIKQDIVTYRGMNEGVYNNLKPGDEKTWKGFTSTSLAQRYADWFKTGSAKSVEVIIPAGSQAAYISRLGEYQGEYEVLLNAGTKFSVISKTDELMTVRIIP